MSLFSERKERELQKCEMDFSVSLLRSSARKKTRYGMFFDNLKKRKGGDAAMGAEERVALAIGDPRTKKGSARGSLTLLP